MDEPNSEERVRKRVVYENIESSTTSGQTGIVIAVIVIIALALVAYIFMHH